MFSNIFARRLGPLFTPTTSIGQQLLHQPNALCLMQMSTRSRYRPEKKPRKRFAAQDSSAGKLQEVERSLWRKQFVLDNFHIPGKYQKYFTGRLRKREQSRMEKQLEQPKEDDNLKRISARTITVDEKTQLKKIDLMRGQILRILERHLSTGDLPVRQLSLQYWEITDVLVSFSLKSAICCYKVTARTADENIQPIIRESSEYLNLIVNQELSKGVSRGIGAPRSIRLKFTNSTATSKLIDKMQADIESSEQTTTLE
ncbi:hypothetical protein LPJ66_004311 [Kickxella alabastrina]|uniref:Uncharacterized protein n=1 Tax=Kickxella alabastrina TaxID=61397 RepID=A0ACC1IIB9_9FUNG|nr:hypothetical protein LPJ66_004311 [Kickxella alabastrina]